VPIVVLILILGGLGWAWERRRRNNMAKYPMLGDEKDERRIWGEHAGEDRREQRETPKKEKPKGLVRKPPTHATDFNFANSSS
jgi:hypothetical protein